MADPPPLCDWCGSLMGPIDAVETGMRRGYGLVWLCSNRWCRHEIERSVQFRWEHELLQTIWQTRLVRVLTARASVYVLGDDAAQLLAIWRTRLVRLLVEHAADQFYEDGPEWETLGSDDDWDAVLNDWCGLDEWKPFYPSDS